MLETWNELDTSRRVLLEMVIVNGGRPLMMSAKFIAHFCGDGNLLTF